MLHCLPARLGRVDLDGRGGALDGLHLPEPRLHPREEEGGAVQGGGDELSFLQIKDVRKQVLLINCKGK